MSYGRSILIKKPGVLSKQEQVKLCIDGEFIQMPVEIEVSVASCCSASQKHLALSALNNESRAFIDWLRNGVAIGKLITCFYHETSDDDRSERATLTESTCECSHSQSDHDRVFFALESPPHSKAI